MNKIITNTLIILLLLAFLAPVTFAYTYPDDGLRVFRIDAVSDHSYDLRYVPFDENDPRYVEYGFTDVDREIGFPLVTNEHGVWKKGDDDDAGDDLWIGNVAEVTTREGLYAVFTFNEEKVEFTITSPNGREATGSIFPVVNNEIDMTFDAGSGFSEFSFEFQDAFDDAAELEIRWAGEEQHSCPPVASVIVDQGCVAYPVYEDECLVDYEVECEDEGVHETDDGTITGGNDFFIVTDGERRHTEIILYDATKFAKKSISEITQENLVFYGLNRLSQVEYRIVNKNGYEQDSRLSPGDYFVVAGGYDQAWKKTFEERKVSFSVNNIEMQPKVYIGLYHDTSDQEPGPFFEVEHYIAVVGKNAPSSDVVNAANFAAAMKQLYGVEFTGKTTEQLRRELNAMKRADYDDYLAESLIVRFVNDKYAVYGRTDSLGNEYLMYHHLTEQGFGQFGLGLTGHELLERWILPELDEQGFLVDNNDVVDWYEDGDDETDWFDDDVPTVEEDECRTGCFKNDQCVPYGIRTKNGEAIYCDLSGEFLPQVSEGQSCQNDYECLSNTCSNGACIDLARELQENRGVLEAILNWLRNLF